MISMGLRFPKLRCFVSDSNQLNTDKARQWIGLDEQKQEKKCLQSSICFVFLIRMVVAFVLLVSFFCLNLFDFGVIGGKAGGFVGPQGFATPSQVLEKDESLGFEEPS